MSLWSFDILLNVRISWIIHLSLNPDVQRSTLNGEKNRAKRETLSFKMTIDLVTKRLFARLNLCNFRKEISSLSHIKVIFEKKWDRVDRCVIFSYDVQIIDNLSLVTRIGHTLDRIYECGTYRDDSCILFRLHWMLWLNNWKLPHEIIQLSQVGNVSRLQTIPRIFP